MDGKSQALLFPFHTGNLGHKHTQKARGLVDNIQRNHKIAKA
jgi:hypothetical protein